VKPDKPILIVGAGLAGSLLAWRFMQANHPVQLIHQPRMTSASRVAAGIINPVTGQRLVLQAQIQNLLHAALHLYAELADFFHINFFFAKPILRSLNHERLQQAWQKRQTDPAYQAYLSPMPDDGQTIKQHHTGYLDTHALLDALHTYFQQHHCIIESDFSYKNLDIQEKSITWQGRSFSQVIFCEGWRAQNNPWFNYLPFQPAKGDILTFHTTQTLPKSIIHQGKWLLPLTNGRFRLGASYDNQQPLHEKPSPHAKEELLQALSHMPIDRNNITLTEHQSGIRPNTLDKQPFLGTHPKHKNIAIFNGFGSKGSLLIPHYSACMLASIQHKQALPKEADIQRYPCV